MDVKVALISGINGQDGAYLTKFLLEKGYEVHGIIRRSSIDKNDRIEQFLNAESLKLHYGDMTDSSNLIRLVGEIKPDEIYNLAAQSHVQVSFETPEYTANADAIGTLRILEAIRILQLEKKTKFYQASTSELYGKVQEIPQKETTPFYPRSPYAAAKLYAYWITVNYREAYKIYACNGILFNHESPLRGETFVTRKITLAVSRIKQGIQDVLYLGNLDARRDWGYAGDFVEAMWLMLQQESPEDFVIATGKTYEVREFVELAFREVGITLKWEDSEENERGVDVDSGKVVVAVDPKYYRPTEVELLLGDASKAEEKLGWKSKVDLEDLVKMMMQADMAYVEKKEFYLKSNR